MKQLEGSDKRQLKGLAHSLKPLVQVGRNGVTGNLIRTIGKALDDHELIKVKFLEYKTERSELSRVIAEKTSSDLIGNVIILYRQNPDPAMRKIRLKA